MYQILKSIHPCVYQILKSIHPCMYQILKSIHPYMYQILRLQTCISFKRLNRRSVIHSLLRSSYLIFYRYLKNQINLFLHVCKNFMIKISGKKHEIKGMSTYYSCMFNLQQQFLQFPSLSMLH